MNDKPASAELPSFRLDGRIAVVTGASEGIGRAFALAFAKAGAEVIIASRRRRKLLEVQRSIRESGGRVQAVTADVSKLVSVHALAKRVAKLAGDKSRPLILINNAGFAFTKSALEVTEKDWDHILDVHAKGTFFCTQAIGRLMIERGYGKIINMSSTWSTSTDTGKSVYGLAKAAVSYLTAALATEWGPEGVRINAIAPTTTLSENTI
ncbi:MAG: SDR family NAD(P)-dependent oxidoreductase, partial [Terriglobia bacterium]